MRRASLHSLYDTDYAKSYDERYLHSPTFKDKTIGEVKIIDKALSALEGPPKWLDIACGTGYFLAQFPSHERAGLDFSPGMLTLARDRNPDATFYQGDMRKRQLFPPGSWSFITSMWYAYMYLGTVNRIQKFIRNASYWLTDTGLFFFPVCPFENIAPGAPIDCPYPLVSSHPVVGGPIWISAVQWSWEEPNGKYHENLIVPHPALIKETLENSFASVRLIRYSQLGDLGFIASKSTRDLSGFQDMFPDHNSYRRLWKEGG